MIRSSIFTLLFSLLLITLSCSESESSHEASHLLKFINSPKKLRAIRNAKFDLLRERKDSRSPIYVGEQHGLMAEDRIEELPGQPEGVKLEQFAGYVTVDPVKGRALFYYFVESDQDSGSKPLVLWLNGGPGCSSFGIGAMQELGPFRVNSDGEYLSSNKAAWNNVANVIFLESPAGVGFSYSNTSSDYQRTGDKSTADDSYTFLINWLDRFPHYKNRDFFITGESYAGHYIPELASLILNKNRAAKNTIIQLKGIAMGNAYIDGATNDKAMYNYLWTHALIADETYKGIQSSCDFSASSITDDCNNILNTVNHDIDDIDIYDIYAPLCKSGSNDMKTTVQPDPCAGNYVHNYLNLIAVQKALHINSPLPHLWKACGGALKGWHDAPLTLLPTIQELMKTDLRIWIYSGDQDALVSVTSTRYSIEMLKLQVESQWKPWYTNGEVGGYVIGYKGLVLATVRGAGHEVPSYQPERSLTLFSSFLKGGFEKN